MRSSKTVDILLNVILPVMAGFIIYLLQNKYFEQGIIRNYLPDGLWAYALFSCILIIWSRQVPVYWCIMITLFAISIEALQFFHFIGGTGDIMDIVTYLLFFTIALLSNKYFHFTFNHKTNSS